MNAAETNSESQTVSARSRYFIASCPKRHKPFTVCLESTGSAHGRRQCPACGLRAEFIPGPYYSADFLDTVKRVIDALHAANPCARAAQSAAEQLDGISRDATLQQLHRALSGLHGLEALDTLLPADCAPTRQNLWRFVSLARALLLVYADHQGRASARLEL